VFKDEWLYMDGFMTKHSFYGNAVIIKKIEGAEFKWGFG
jgi:hypothetical protein